MVTKFTDSYRYTKGWQAMDDEFELRRQAEMRRGAEVAARNMAAEGKTPEYADRVLTMDRWERDKRIIVERMFWKDNNTLQYSRDKGTVGVRVGTCFFNEEIGVYPSEQLVARVGLALQAGMDRVKCLTPGCENHASEGRFVGEYCAPCAAAYRKSGWHG